ncbi:peroxiredoxin [Mumia sp. zg.B53]|uniref:peroxiredoxin n=1 Tax=unclassified Mumia TaxID=2621872 RepID=UPI001C6F51E1|nr:MULTISPECIES: peroxiredoxin [unclassified Mumia]MBW9206374.1 peroxiredoxin [Mumia sp. zg.B17]MBW9211336.1 peroxiredoxin [Mumia sp. zg.B21]MBW9215911.1 peroxiredoxin [Mumia sp. zg.B53]MDD9349270.1 peroxiredoxin [Mumia sp.]
MTIEIGTTAPDFTLKNQHGEEVSLSALRGKKTLLVFYPFAFSGICSGELCELRDNLAAFNELDADVLAISCDPMFALRAFSEKDGLTFSLLSDFWPHGAVATSYGVFDADRGCALRGSFLVDEEGVVRWKIENGLPDARDLAGYLGALQEISA